MLHDENYKRLFASPLMVQDVLRACLPAHRLAAADLSSLGKLSAEYVSDELRTRHGDTVWHRLASAPWPAPGVSAGAAMICPTATCCARWRGWSRAGRRRT